MCRISAVRALVNNYCNDRNHILILLHQTLSRSCPSYLNHSPGSAISAHQRQQSPWSTHPWLIPRSQKIEIFHSKSNLPRKIKSITSFRSKHVRNHHTLTAGKDRSIIVFISGSADIISYQLMHMRFWIIWSITHILYSTWSVTSADNVAHKTKHRSPKPRNSWNCGRRNWTWFNGIIVHILRLPICNPIIN